MKGIGEEPIYQVKTQTRGLKREETKKQPSSLVVSERLDKSKFTFTNEIELREFEDES